MTGKTKRMKVRVSPPLGVEGARVVEMGDNAAMHVPFTAEFSNDDIVIRMTIDVRDDRPVCLGYQVDALNGDDLLMKTTEVARGYNIRHLAAEACAVMAMERIEPGESIPDGALRVDIGNAQFTTAASLSVIEDVIGPIRSRREPITDDRLREVAEKYGEHYEPGGMAAFADLINTGERQAWRLVKLARERGFIKPKDGQS